MNGTGNIYGVIPLRIFFHFTATTEFDDRLLPQPNETSSIICLFDFSKVPQCLNSETHLIEEFWKTGCVPVIATSQVCHRLLAQEIQYL